MARWGNCDFSQLKDLQKQMERMQRNDFEAFCKECAKELAARLLAKVIKRTAVGQYPAETGKKGGTLRRGWTAKTEEEAIAGGVPGAKEYANALEVTLSIHAPHAGSDNCGLSVSPTPFIFQSTPPMRGATHGRQQRRHIPGLSIHAPHAGSDNPICLYFSIFLLSIHAPHAGSDSIVKGKPQMKLPFNPRPPCGERQRKE